MSQIRQTAAILPPPYEFGATFLDLGAAALRGTRSLYALIGKALSTKVVGAALQFAMQVVFARVFGVNAYGIFVASTSLARMLSQFSMLGSNNALLKLLAGNTHYRVREAAADLIGRILLSLTAINLIVAAILIWGIDSPEFVPQSVALTFAAVLTLAYVLNEVLRGALSGLGSPVIGLLSESVVRPGIAMTLALTTLAAPAWLAWSRDPLTTYLVAAFCGVLFLGALVWRKLTLLPRDPAARPPQPSMGEFAAFGTVSGFQVLNGQVDVFLVGALLGAEQAAHYGAATRIKALVIFVLTSASVVTAPQIAHRWQSGDRAGLRILLREVTLLTTVAGFAAVALLVLFGPWILSLFGTGFASAYPELVILVFSQFVTAACGPMVFVNTMTNSARYAAKVFVGAALANVALSVTLIPLFGPAGAALAVLASTLVWNILLSLNAARILRS